jgi:Tol biopolymer transport system component
VDSAGRVAGRTSADDAIVSRAGGHLGRRHRWSGAEAGDEFIYDTRDWSKAPERLPSSGKPQTYLRDWSPDGKRLAADDPSNNVYVFDLVARTWERVGTGQLPRWLADGRRLVAVSRGHISVIDTMTKSERDIYEEPGRFLASVALAPDGGQLYFTSAATQSDVWTMRFGR